MSELYHDVLPSDISRKRCPSCGKKKFLDEFYRCKYNRDGHQSSCKDCEDAKIKEKHRIVSLKRITLLAVQAPLFAPEIAQIEHTIPDCNCIGKRCSACKILRCRSLFNHHKKESDGLRGQCKLCEKAYRETHAEEIKAYNRTEERLARHRAYYQRNIERLRMQKRQYHHANVARIHAYQRNRHRTHSALYKEHSRRYRITHIAECHASNKTWRQANPEKAQANLRAWERKHPERARLHRMAVAARRRTRATQAGGSFTIAEWQALKAKYNYHCLCCGKQEPEIKLTSDHVIPVIKHGPSNIENIQPLCGSCNSKKHDKIIDYRLNWRKNCNE